ncbi:MAG: hypothetical protein JXB49_29260 [Bacteroidales bacterium]|nr:hypothetical protein [Bacteroidales bacterium]
MKICGVLLFITVQFLFISAQGQQQGLNQQLMHAAADGDLNKVKELIGQGADIEYLNEHGYSVIDYASTVEIVDYLHKLGMELSLLSYEEHCLRFAYNEPGDHMQIMKYFIENKAVQEHDFSLMYDANLNQMIYLPEYIEFLKAHNVKYDKKKYSEMMDGYFEAAKENFFYGDTSSYYILKKFLSMGIGIDQACKGFGEFYYGYYPELYKSYFYYMDSVGIDLTGKENKSQIKWMGYSILGYAAEVQDYSSIDFLLWLASKGVFDETAILFLGEIYFEDPRPELYYLDGLEKIRYKYSKHDCEIVYNNFLNAFYLFVDDSSKYKDVLKYTRFVKNQKLNLSVWLDINSNQDLDEIINIIFALDHDNNRLVSKSSLTDLLILYEIFFGDIDDTKYEEYINFQSGRGRTMLMVASRLGDLKAVKSLVDKGADVSLKDVEGMTAIDYAKNTKIKNYLSKIV